MASQLYQPGPIGLFVGPQNVLGGGNGVKFLGYGKMSPQSEFISTTAPVYADYGGTREPTDKGWAGEKAIIAVDLSQFDYLVLEQLKSYPNQNAAFLTGIAGPVAPGNHPFGNRGALLRTEGRMLTVFLLHLNMLAPAMAILYPGQIAGRRFPCCELKQNTFDGKPLEQNQTVRLVFEATELPNFDNSTSGIPGLPNWLLCDYQIQGLPSLS